jgi:hypothetical protein
VKRPSRVARQGAAKVVVAAVPQRHRVEREGQVRLLEREEAAGMVHDVRVGDAEVLAAHRGVGLGRVAEGAEQGAARRALQLEFRRAHPPVAVSDGALLQPEGVDHAVAAEPVVVAPGSELRVGPVPIERAAQA